MSPRSPGSESGIAVAVALLFGLALVLLAHGTLVLARTQRWAAAREGARLEAESRGRAAVLSMVEASGDSLPPPGVRETPHGPVEIQSGGPELRGVLSLPTAAPGEESSVGWGAVLAAPRPVPRVLGREAAFRLGGVSFLSGGSLRTGGPGDPCPPEAAVGRPVGVGPLPEGDTLPGLGPLRMADLVGRLPALGTDALRLAPDGVPGCGEAGSFGDPIRPGTCPASWGGAGRVGSLRMEGAGQGVLAVTGDLVMAPGAVFRGWVWVGGALRLEGEARLVGLADVGGDLVVSPVGALEADGCAAAAALAGTPTLTRPTLVGPPAWPVFRR